MPRTLDDLDTWAREHELQHLRDKAERREADVILLDSVKRHVDVSLASMKELPAKIDALVKVNDTQLGMMREAAEERGRRVQRESDALEKRSTEQIEIERLKVENERVAKEAALAAEKAEKEAARKADRWKVAAGVVTAIATGLLTYLAAHHH